MKLIPLLALATILVAADKNKPEEPKIGNGHGASDRMEIIATVHANKAAVKQILGDDMKGYIYVVEVLIKPRVEEGVKIDRDDFQLLITDDGQKTKPFAPAQLTGTGGLVLKSEKGPTSGIMGQNNGPVWRGPVGTGGPMRMPGNGNSVGNATTQIDTPTVSENESKEKENPMKKVLEAKELPAAEMKEPTKGLLYFPIDGKHKVKNIVLLYRGLGGRIDVEFK